MGNFPLGCLGVSSGTVWYSRFLDLACGRVGSLVTVTLGPGGAMQIVVVGVERECAAGIPEMDGRTRSAAGPGFLLVHAADYTAQAGLAPSAAEPEPARRTTLTTKFKPSRPAGDVVGGDVGPDGRSVLVLCCSLLVGPGTVALVTSAADTNW